MPDHESSEANASGSVVSRLNHHAGRGQRVDDGAWRERRRDREAVAGVAQPRPGDRYVDGHHEGVEPRLRGPLDQRHGAVAVLPHVELEPLPGPGRGRGDVLDRGGAHGRERVGDAGRLRRRHPGDLALGLHQPGEPGGRDPERQRRSAPRAPRGRCRRCDTSRRIDGWNSTSRERLPGPAQRHLAVGGTVGVVERGPGSTPLRDPPQVLDRQRGGQPALPGRQHRPLELQQRRQVVAPGQPAAGHGVLCPRKNSSSSAVDSAAQDAGDHLGPVVEAPVADHVPEAADRAGLVVVGPEDHAGHPGQDRGTGAHRARLERHDEGAALEPPAAGRLAPPRAAPRSRRARSGRASASRTLRPRPTTAPSGSRTTAPIGTSPVARAARASSRAAPIGTSYDGLIGRSVRRTRGRRPRRRASRTRAGG